VGTKRISNANLVNLTVIFAMFLWSFSAGVVNISLPTIAQFLDISTAQASWVIIGHMLVLVSTLLFFARLSDYIGHKTIFMWGLLIFIISSYLCGLSLDIYLLIFYRLTMGLGSAMLLSVSPAIISTVSTFDVRGRAFGYISLATTLGLSVGYLVGGFITENLGWNYVFFLSVPLGVVVLLMAQAHFKISPLKKSIIIPLM
jgi:DHA2 family metal-tetracycline-proton antiporter-like MFS transporter